MTQTSDIRPSKPARPRESEVGRVRFPCPTESNAGRQRTTVDEECRHGVATAIGEVGRFRAFITPEPNTGCWLWSGGLQSRGYGFFCLADATMVLAHRYSYELELGPIAEHLEIDHVCRQKSCVNPGHLEAVTRSENTLRRYRAARGVPVRTTAQTSPTAAPTEEGST